MNEDENSIRLAYRRMEFKIIPRLAAGAAAIRNDMEALIMARLFRGWANDIVSRLSSKHGKEKTQLLLELLEQTLKPVAIPGSEVGKA